MNKILQKQWKIKTNIISTEVPSQKLVGLNPGAFKRDFHLKYLFK